MISGIGNTSQLSSKLFSALDTKNQGYLEKSDLASAFSKLSSNSAESSSVDDVFSALDSDSNGQVTESEFSSTLAKLQEQLDSQFNQMRMQGGGGHGGPQGAGGPPPPPPADDAGFSKDELTSQLEEMGSSDSQRSSTLSNIVNNFAAADSNSDGKVSFSEAMAYDQSSKSGSSTDNSSTTSTSTHASDNSDAKIMMKIMQLMHAYTQQDQSGSTVSNLLSVSA